MNERQSNVKWRAIAFTAAVVVVVGGLVAGAFALASSTGGNGATASAVTTAPPAATAPSSVNASVNAAAKPAVCGNVRGVTVMDDDMVMAPVPNRPPAPADEAAARQLVVSVTAGISKYSQLSAAVADGYVPATKPTGYVVHYANWAVVRAGDVLDAGKPSSLVYANTVAGPVLLGAMFLGPAPCEPGPDVAGPLTQWHAHADLCLAADHQVVGKSSANGACAVGVHNTNTYFMMHVWTAPSLASTYQFQAHVPAPAFGAIIRSGQA